MNSNSNPNYKSPMGSAQNSVPLWDPQLMVDLKRFDKYVKEVMEMFKFKFRIGDRVRVKKDLKVHERRGGLGVSFYMYSKRGFIGYVTNLGEEEGTHIPFIIINNLPVRFSPEMLEHAGREKVKPERIVIYRNDKRVVAKNTATGKTAEARCHPSDEFDFNTGAKLAFERLVNPESEKPKYYSGKVVCIDARTNEFTKGKIYEVKNGRMKTDLSHIVEPGDLSPYTSFENLTLKLASKFIELVENESEVEV